jgi:monoamine oxidase
MSLERRDVDVAIVGAGLSGLGAARRLHERGVPFAVLEARDEVGGRTLATSIGDGKIVELGGEYAGPRDTRSIQLARELGIALYPTYNDGLNISEVRGRIGRYKGFFGPSMGLAALADLGQALGRFNLLSKRLHADQWGQARGAERLDDENIGTWMRRNLVTRDGQEIFKIIIRGVWGAEPAEVSLLHALAFIGITAGGSLDYMARTAKGAQDSRFIGGSQELSKGLAARFPESVVLGSPTRRIEQRKDSVRIVGDRHEVTARRVIVAMAPNMAHRLVYEPVLPPYRDHLTQRLGQGAVTKVMPIYDEPFWRRDGLTGQSMSTSGLVQVTYDNSPPDGSPGILMGVVMGARALELSRMPEKVRRGVVLGELGRLFGPRALHPIGYVEKDWAADEWARGCYHCYASPGVLVPLERDLRAPIGRIHWAGTETAVENFGGMNGALEAGYRAADEVTAAEQHSNGSEPALESAAA